MKDTQQGERLPGIYVYKQNIARHLGYSSTAVLQLCRTTACIVTRSPSCITPDRAVADRCCNRHCSSSVFSCGMRVYAQWLQCGVEVPKGVTLATSCLSSFEIFAEIPSKNAHDRHQLANHRRYHVMNTTEIQMMY